jgi:hypothetical protein
VLGGTSTGPFKADRGWQVGTTLFHRKQLGGCDLVSRGRWPPTTDPELRAQSFEIARKYLDQSGLLTGEHKDSARFILNRIDRMMLRGERRRLLLSNAAIDAYRLRPALVSLNA